MRKIKNHFNTQDTIVFTWKTFTQSVEIKDLGVRNLKSTISYIRR